MNLDPPLGLHFHHFACTESTTAPNISLNRTNLPFGHIPGNAPLPAIVQMRRLGTSLEMPLCLQLYKCAVWADPWRCPSACNRTNAPFGHIPGHAPLPAIVQIRRLGRFLEMPLCLQSYKCAVWAHPWKCPSACRGPTSAAARMARRVRACRAAQVTNTTRRRAAWCARHAQGLEVSPAHWRHT